MGNAARDHEVTIQYCMSLPRHILQSVEVPAVTQARASRDYQPGNDQWRAVGMTSIFLHALRIAPSKDNFWTTDKITMPRYGTENERHNRLQGVVSTLSTGPVAVSDPIGMTDRDLVMRSCAADGRLLAPDTPARAASDMFLAIGELAGANPLVGEVWVARTTISSLSYYYVLAVETSPYPLTLTSIIAAGGAPPAGTPIDNTYLAFETNHSRSVFSVNRTQDLQIASSDKWSFGLYTLAPVLPNGWTLLGETKKWVALSRARVRSLDVSDRGLTLVLTGEPGEEVELWFCRAGTNLPASQGAVIGTDRTVTVVLV